jgi:hypothetical protein
MDGVDRERRIDTLGATFGYGNGDSSVAWNATDRTSCFYMIHSALFSQEWLTVTNALRVGDQLRLAFVADNNTETIRTAGLHIDNLHLDVIRSRRPMRFLVAYSVSYDNSARMVRREGH